MACSERRDQQHDADGPSGLNSYPVPWTWTSVYTHAPSQLRYIPCNAADAGWRDRDWLGHLRQIADRKAR